MNGQVNNGLPQNIQSRKSLIIKGLFNLPTSSTGEGVNREPACPGFLRSSLAKPKSPILT